MVRGRKHTVGDFQRIELYFLVSEWNRVKAKVKRGQTSVLNDELKKQRDFIMTWSFGGNQEEEQYA